MMDFLYRESFVSKPVIFYVVLNFLNKALFGDWPTDYRCQ